MSAHLQREIDKLKRQVLSLSTIVQENVRAAVKSIEERDEVSAGKVIESDVEIDHREVEVEEECLKILALYQPVAIDLRFILAVLKINSDLERIGDLAVNIAERVSFLAAAEPVPIPFDFTAMTDKAQAMLGRSLDALVNMDSALARQVCAADDEVDALNREMYDQVKAAICRNPDKLESLIHFMSVSHDLERIADHATNIAEDVIYMSDAKIIRHRAEDYRERSSD